MSIKVDLTKPIRKVGTHHPCRVLCTDRKGHRNNVFVLVDYEHSEKFIACSESEVDRLFENVPPPRTSVWRNLYEHRDNLLGVGSSTKALADSHRNRDYHRSGVLEFIMEGDRVVDVTFHPTFDDN